MGSTKCPFALILGSQVSLFGADECWGGDGDPWPSLRVCLGPEPQGGVLTYA